MNDKKHIFISYSRKDSKFVLNLAKDLKKYDFDIWVDQFNIPGGEHWDDNIEKALDNSCALILILSPSSVASDRVKDEVSYALENNIHIIPIRYKETQIPYRWRRLQSMEINEKNYDKKIDSFIESIANFNTCKKPPQKQDFDKPKKTWFKILALSILAVVAIFLFFNNKSSSIDTSIEEPKSITTVNKVEDINSSKKITESLPTKTPKLHQPQEVVKNVEVAPKVEDTPKIEFIPKTEVAPKKVNIQQKETTQISDNDTSVNVVKDKVLPQKVVKSIEPEPKIVTKDIDANDPYQEIYNRYLIELQKDKSTKLIIISHTNANNEYDKAQERAYGVSLDLRNKGIKRANIVTKVEMDGKDKITFDFRKMVK